MSNWLNTTFYALDNGAFNFMSSIQKSIGVVFTPFMEFISLLGEKGLAFILFGVILLLFRKTRKTGLCVLLAIALGGIIVNIILKNWVARPRPFNASDEYKALWQAVGGEPKSSYSFPSGHTNVAMNCLLAFFLCTNKKKSWPVFILVFLMAFSRVYLIVHYFTDVIGGILAGAIAGVGGYYLGKFLWSLVENYNDTKVCSFIMDFDIGDFAKKVFNKKTKE